MSSFILHLMRHGAPLEEGLLLGRTDLPATDEGLNACYAMAAQLSFDRVVTSPLLRACIAAEHIAAHAGVALVKDERWQEMDFGAWDGLSSDVVRAHSGAALSNFYADPDTAPPPNGERWSDLCIRIKAALNDIDLNIAHIADTSVLVLTHGGAMRAAISVLCKLGHQQSWLVDLPYASVLTLRVHKMNDASLAGQVIALAHAPS